MQLLSQVADFGENGLFIVAAFVAVGIGIFFARRRWDRARIKCLIESQGGKLIEIRRDVWSEELGSLEQDRWFKVRYVDSDGQTHRKQCRTSSRSGVYFPTYNIQDECADQTAKRDADQNSRESQRSLEEENRRLREELARMRQAKD
jgi:hypothetical protein